MSKGKMQGIGVGIVAGNADFSTYNVILFSILFITLQKLVDKYPCQQYWKALR